jgi:hypothetical protein
MMARVPNGEVPRKRRLSPKARRALELLANNPQGITEDLLLAHGFSRRMLAGFLRSELATWNYQTVMAGGRRIEVNYMTITEAGRRAIGAG